MLILTNNNKRQDKIRKRRNLSSVKKKGLNENEKKIDKENSMTLHLFFQLKFH